MLQTHSPLHKFERYAERLLGVLVTVSTHPIANREREKGKIYHFRTFKELEAYGFTLSQLAVCTEILLNNAHIEKLEYRSGKSEIFIKATKQGDAAYTEGFYPKALPKKKTVISKLFQIMGLGG